MWKEYSQNIYYKNKSHSGSSPQIQILLALYAHIVIYIHHIDLIWKIDCHTVPAIGLSSLADVGFYIYIWVPTALFRRQKTISLLQISNFPLVHIRRFNRQQLSSSSNSTELNVTWWKHLCVVHTHTHTHT